MNSKAIVFLVSMICVAPTALAHKLNLFAFAEGDRVYVEGYFADGAKAKNSEIKVYTSNREIILEGRTDEQGTFSFQKPAQNELRIVLNAGMGHQTEQSLTLGESASDAGVAVDSAAPSSATADGATPDQVRAAVTEAITPLAREIDALKNKSSVSDIVGGIGFIVGLFGAFAYFKSRQKAST